MFKFLDKNNPPTKVFVTSSLLLLFIFILLLLYFIGNYERNENNVVLDSVNINEFNPVDISDDPYITYFGNQDDEDIKPQISKYDPKYGPENAEVNIIYFGDYTCLYCLEQIDMIKGIINEREDVNLIWKDYPEDNISSNSWKGALAGRCAQSQNKFWEFLDSYSSQYSTFRAQSGLSEDQFNNFILGLAEASDLNMNKFKSCYNNLEHSDVLATSIVEARALKLPGVPYTYINERELLGEFNSELLKDEIERVLAK
ncbi:DsbA family protein [Patescibacteria group bacterium]|nr:DsbA family protein [Patescibacteria group bacterium]